MSKDTESTMTNRVTDEMRAELAAMKKQIAELMECISWAPPNPLPELVKIPDRSYEVGKYSVTFEEYDAFCDATGTKKPSDNGWGRGRQPVINVSWNDAQEYIAWLNEIAGEDGVWCMSNEDAFEHYAADHREATTETAVFMAKKPEPVGSREPNKFGLYDVLGNVWEWQEDSYD